MDFAAVDIGNTAVKICRWKGGHTDWHASREPLEAAVEECRGAGGVAFCTTRRLTGAETELVEGAGWWQLRHGRKVPLTVDYATPETLGADRLAAAVGAHALYPDVTALIADAGTALTLDVVTADGTFKGGNISLGLDMRFRALHDFTSMLPRVDFIGERKWFGKNTVEAIRGGARWGIVNEIAGAYRMAREKFGCSLIVLTGGYGPLAYTDFREVWGEGIRVVKEHALVATGLKKAYEYNHE